MAALLGLVLSLSSCAAETRPAVGSVTLCANCHNRSGNDQVGEWLDTPYSRAEGGLECVDCHGPHCSGMVRSDGGRPNRRTTTPARVARPAADLTVTAICSGGAVETEIAVSNMGAGHDLPTGPAARRLVVEVIARGPDGRSLTPIGDPESSDMAGLPVTVPARDSPNPPPAAACSSVRPRLPAFGTDLSRYRFAAPQGAGARVEARLLIVPARGAGQEIARGLATCIPSSHVEEVRP